MNRKHSVTTFFEIIALILRKKRKMHKDNYDRGTAFLESMVKKNTVVLHKLARNFGEERAYGRLMQNNKVSSEDIVENYRPAVPLNLHEKHVLIINDTSEISFGLNSGKTGLGKVGNGNSEGFFLHPCIGMDASNGACLGLGALEVHLRQEYHPTELEITKAKESLEKSALKKAQKTGEAPKAVSERRILSEARESHQKTLPFDVKDRYRWIDGPLGAARYYEGAGQLTVVADKESDLFPVFVGFNSQKVGFVIRSSHDRYLDCARSGANLHSAAQEWSVECCYKVKLPATDKRSAHVAILNVSYRQVELACPETLLDYKLPLRDGQLIPMPPSLSVYAVRVFESPQSVVNNEKAIEWLLLTSIPVTNAEQALDIVQYYRWRWTIEQIFRTLKSKGLDIQHSQLPDVDELIKLAVFALIAATLIMQLVQARDGNTNQDIQEVFDDVEIQAIQALNTQLEGKTEKQKNPYPKYSLAFAVWVIARLGGWKPNASPRPPGPVTILNGVTIFHNIMTGFQLKLEPLFQGSS
jgi:hypothetical protein